MLVDSVLWVLGDGDTELGKEQLSARKELCLSEEGQVSKRQLQFSATGGQRRRLLQKRGLYSAWGWWWEGFEGGAA